MATTAAPRRTEGWATLFASAFRQSRNVMVLGDEHRRIVDVNGACLSLLGNRRDGMVGRPIATFVAGGPLVSPAEWAQRLASGRFHGEVGLIAADGTIVDVQWGAVVETITGRRLVLFVATNTARWGRHFRRPVAAFSGEGAELSPREHEIVRLVSLGYSGPEIADELGIAHDTVRTHVRNAMDKLGARSRAHLVAKALGDGQVLA
jgi:PAS domain S-box-containing protein